MRVIVIVLDAREYGVEDFVYLLIHLLDKAKRILVVICGQILDILHPLFKKLLIVLDILANFGKFDRQVRTLAFALALSDAQGFGQLSRFLVEVLRQLLLVGYHYFFSSWALDGVTPHRD